MATSLTNLLVFKMGQLPLDDQKGPASDVVEDHGAIMLPSRYLERSRSRYKKFQSKRYAIYHYGLENLGEEWARWKIENSETMNDLRKVTVERRGDRP